MTRMQLSPAGEGLPDRREDLLSPAAVETLFWQPRFIADPALMLHVPLLFWLVEAARPARLAVLGAGEGAALFALCQALDKLNIAGRCEGIGFWTDARTGAPLASPPGAIRDHARQLYADLAHVRAAANAGAALDGIRDGSLDLLLVDLCRLPAGVAPDLAEWRRVVKRDGLLVLHGIAQSGTAGTGRLIDQGPRLEFPDGAGLALLPQGEDLPPRLRALMRAAPDGIVAGEIGLVFRRLGQGLEAMARQAADAARADAGQKALAAAQKSQAEAEKVLAELRDAYDSRSRRLGELQAELFSLRHETDQLHEDLAALTWQLEESRGNEKAQRERAETERATRFRETAALTGYLEELRDGGPALEELRAQLKRSEERNGGLQAELGAARQELEALRAENRRLSDYTAELLNSTSWRITAPMRKVKDTFRG